MKSKIKKISSAEGYAQTDERVIARFMFKGHTVAEMDTFAHLLESVQAVRISGSIKPLRGNSRFWVMFIADVEGDNGAASLQDIVQFLSKLRLTKRHLQVEPGNLLEQKQFIAQITEACKHKHQAEPTSYNRIDLWYSDTQQETIVKIVSNLSDLFKSLLDELQEWDFTYMLVDEQTLVFCYSSILLYTFLDKLESDSRVRGIRMQRHRFSTMDEVEQLQRMVYNHMLQRMDISAATRLIVGAKLKRLSTPDPLGGQDGILIRYWQGERGYIELTLRLDKSDPKIARDCRRRIMNVFNVVEGAGIRVRTMDRRLLCYYTQAAELIEEVKAATIAICRILDIDFAELPYEGIEAKAMHYTLLRNFLRTPNLDIETRKMLEEDLRLDRL